MEITKEVLQASIASMEMQLQNALAQQAKAAEEVAMIRGGIVACNQLLEHLAKPDPPPPGPGPNEPPGPTDEEPPTIKPLDPGDEQTTPEE